MLVDDVYAQNRRLWAQLREKGGRRHAMPCHHNLEEYLVAYLNGAGLRDDPEGPLFRTIGRGTSLLTRNNHSAHVSRETTNWLAAQPIGRFTFTFTPTHGSWLNLIESFFSEAARSVLRHIRVGSKVELKQRNCMGVAFGASMSSGGAVARSFTSR